MIGRRTRERAALVVISDGADTASDLTVAEVRTSLLRSEAFVYAIAIDSPSRQAINTRVNAAALGEITGQSGGRTEVVQDMDGPARRHRAHRRGTEQPVRDGLRLAARDRREVSQHPRARHTARLQGPRPERIRRRGQAEERVALSSRCDINVTPDLEHRNCRHHGRWLATLARLAQMIAPDNEAEIKALEADCGRYLGYVRAVGRRQGDVPLAEHPVSVPTDYVKQPLLRDWE